MPKRFVDFLANGIVQCKRERMYDLVFTQNIYMYVNNIEFVNDYVSVLPIFSNSMVSFKLYS